MAAAGRCSSSSWLPLQPVPELFWKFLVGCGHSSPACFLLWRAVLPSMSLCTLQRASHRSQQNDHRNDQYHSAYCQDFEEIMDLIIVGTWNRIGWTGNMNEVSWVDWSFCISSSFFPFFPFSFSFSLFPSSFFSLFFPSSLPSSV